MDLRNGNHRRDNPNHTDNMMQNFSTVVITNIIQHDENVWTTDMTIPKISNESASTPSTPEARFDAAKSGWLLATDILDVFVFVCACVALLFNVSNIFVIIISKLYRKTTYKLFISQAVSNAVTALSVGMFFVSAEYLTGETKLIIAICSYNILQIGSMACVLTYTLLSLELYFQIILPLKHRSIGFTFKVALIFIWLIPVIITESIQVGITLSRMAPNETFLVTYIRLQDNTLGYFNTGLALICLIVIIYLNSVILRTVHQSLRTNPRQGISSKKSTVTIIAMVTSYIIFYLPSWIAGILFVLHYKSQILILASLTMSQRQFLISFLSNLKILNTVSDPVIYVLRITVIQETYKKLIMKLKCCGQVTNTDDYNIKMSSRLGHLYRDKNSSSKETHVSVVSTPSEI